MAAGGALPVVKPAGIEDVEDGPRYDAIACEQIDQKPGGHDDGIRQTGDRRGARPVLQVIFRAAVVVMKHNSLTKNLPQQYGRRGRQQKRKNPAPKNVDDRTPRNFE